MAVALVAGMVLLGCFVGVVIAFFKEVVFDPESTRNKLKKENSQLKKQNAKLQRSNDELAKELKLATDALTVYSYQPPWEYVKDSNGTQE